MGTQISKKGPKPLGIDLTRGPRQDLHKLLVDYICGEGEGGSQVH